MEQMVNRLIRIVPWTLRNQIKQMPGISNLQRAIVSKLLHGKEFTHRVDAGPAKGIKFLVQLPEDKGIWTGTYESVFAAALSSQVPRGGVAYDIGSWHGFFAGVMAAQGARQVHVFEPLPANVERIRELASLNPDKDIVLHDCALGDRDTEMDLVAMPETSMAKLEVSNFQSLETSNARCRVPVRSVDSLIELGEAAPPDIMKIDVEGAELLVLHGALNTLRANHPIIFAEIHSSDLLTESTRFLEDEGYSVSLMGEIGAADLAEDVFQIHATY